MPHFYSATLAPAARRTFAPPFTHVEKWFERAKQEVGLGAFEMRNYQGLMRHWLICGMVMLFLAEQTNRLRGEKSGDHIGAGCQRGQPHRLECLGPA